MAPSTLFNIAIFASGSGTNAEAIMQYFANSNPVRVAILLSNNPDAPALERARKFGVEARSFTKDEFRERGDVINWLKEKNVTHIVLAGFLWLIPASLVKAFPDRIINIHPSLLPKFGGKGMYGSKVHEAVRLAGESVTGITIHSVNEHYDEGKIIFQAQCIIDPTDSAEMIAKRVHALEHDYFPKQIDKWINATPGHN